MTKSETGSQKFTEDVSQLCFSFVKTMLAFLMPLIGGILKDISKKKKCEEDAENNICKSARAMEKIRKL